MNQILLQQIFEKTQGIIEQFDHDVFLQKIFALRATTIQEDRDFFIHYFPDATEELFRGKPELKQQYLNALKEFFRQKYIEGNRSFEFARQLIMPTKSETGGSVYSEENLRQWRKFSLGLATNLEAFTENKVIGRMQSISAQSGPRTAGPRTSEKSGSASFERSELYQKDQKAAQFLSEVKNVLPSFIPQNSLEMEEKDGQLCVRGGVRDEDGNAFEISISEENFRARTAEIYEPRNPSSKMRFNISELALQKPQQIAEKLHAQISPQISPQVSTPLPIPQSLNPSAFRQVQGDMAEHTPKISYGGVQKAKQALAKKTSARKKFTPFETSSKKPLEMPRSEAQTAAPQMNQPATASQAQTIPQRPQARKPASGARPRQSSQGKKIIKWALLGTGAVSGSAGLFTFFF